MTVIQFPVRPSGEPFNAEADVIGSFGSPSGGTGTFTGGYRLERFVVQFGHLAAAGVFTGELTDARGTVIGVGSRRHTAAVELAAGPTALVGRIGPVDVNLLGLLVGVEEFEMHVRRGTTSPTRILDGDQVGGMPPSAAELMARLVSAPDRVPAARSSSAGRAL